jgi:hypothetical protein
LFRQDHVVDLERLLGDLLFGHEDMGVVLGEGAHAHQPVQRARRLEAVHLAEFGELERQVAVRLQSVLEYLHVARAVHRLDGVDARVLLALGGEKHHVRIGRDVAGRDP